MYLSGASMLTSCCSPMGSFKNKYIRILIAILLEMCKWSLMSAKYRLGDGMAVDEKCSHNHYFYATFNFESLDLKIRQLKVCCCLGCYLNKTPRFIAKHTWPILHYYSKNPVAG